LKYVLAIDPATSTGLALVGYEKSGPPVHIRSKITKLPGKKRNEWYERARDSVEEILDGVDRSSVQWILETWSHHRNYRDAIRLAQVQQTWVDMASAMGSSSPPVLYNVTSWQAAIGAGSLKSKVHGKNARKDHAVLWAQKSYRIEGPIKYDIADALCMACVWINENRHRQSTFGFNVKGV